MNRPTYEIIKYQMPSVFEGYDLDLDHIRQYDMLGNERTDRETLFDYQIEAFYVGYIAGIRHEREKRKRIKA